MEKYKNHIFKNEEETIESLDWKDVKNVCSNINSAGGLDVWIKKEFHMISHQMDATDRRHQRMARRPKASQSSVSVQG